MRLDKNATIAGQPIKRVRELLRRMGSAHWSHREIVDFFHIDVLKAHALDTEVMRLLKARSRYLSLHTMDDLEAIGALSRILFKHGSGPR